MDSIDVWCLAFFSVRGDPAASSIACSCAVSCRVFMIVLFFGLDSYLVVFLRRFESR